MFYHDGYELYDGTHGRGAGRCLSGLKHKIHIHYLEVKDDVPWWLVMFVCLVGLCFLPLRMLCLACKYFKLPVN